VRYATNLFRTRFAARTVALANSAESVDELPLASLTNLRAVIGGVAQRMNLDEDILFLFLTSHGSRDARLGVELEGLSFSNFSATALAASLRESKIRWKVIVVSACYSGSFIKALADEHTLVITAASADRTSFGCANGNDFTWFGRAFLQQALNQTASFVDAFALAKKQIAEWEARDHNTPSQPQIAAGKLIEGQLAKWRATLPPPSRVAASGQARPVERAPPKR
jgi:hypothetical protein